MGNPVLTVFGEYEKNVTKDVYIEGQLDLPIEIWGQRGKRIAEADALVSLNQAGVDVARATALARAVRSYGQVTVALEKRRVLREAIASARTEAEMYQARVEQQDATMRDAQLATMEVARNEVLLVEANADLQDGLAQLHRITGQQFDPESEPGTTEAPDGLALAERAPDAETSPLVREARAEASYHTRVSERAGAEGKMPFSLVARGLRSDLGEARFGGGVSIGIPLFQYNQAERARADADAERARTNSVIQENALEALLDGLERELIQLREARKILESTALPAAEKAVSAAEEIQRAGKGDLLPILISRRDYAALRLRRLEIIAREWIAVSNLVSITGTEP